MRTPNLTARSLKATLVLEPAQLAEIVVRDGVPRVDLRIEVAPDGTIGQGRLVTTDIAAKSARKALATIREHRPDGVMAILQGKLGVGDVLLEAGLVVQPKVPKQAAQQAQEARRIGQPKIGLARAFCSAPAD